MRFVEGGGVEVVASAMCRFAEDANMQMRAIRVLHRIGKYGTGSSFAVVQLIDKAVASFGGFEGW
eukprot:18127-Eustigmatos_ZCMA.PRE.1